MLINTSFYKKKIKKIITKINDENYIKESLKWLKAVDFNPWSLSKEIIQKYLSPMEMFCFCEINPNETEISNEKVRMGYWRFGASAIESKEIEDMEKDHQELLKSLQSTFKESSEKSR